MPVPVSVAILSHNDGDQIRQVLASVSWAQDIVVADINSRDGSRDAAREVGARVVEVPWTDPTGTRNRALHEAKNDWVLSLDADEEVTPELGEAIRSALEAGGERLAAVSVQRLSHHLGRPLRHAAWCSGKTIRLGRLSRGFRVVAGRWGEVYRVDGPAEDVVAVAPPLLHHPYVSISQLLRKASDRARLVSRDSGKSLLLGPAVEFLRCYLPGRGFLNGSAGLGAAYVRAATLFLAAAFRLEKGG